MVETSSSVSIKDPTPDDELNMPLELAMAQLDRQFGKGAVVRLTDEPTAWPAIQTGALTLDIALGIGGLPKGRIVEIYGAESCGKSTLCMTVVANAQKNGGRCLYVDAEHAVDPVYARTLGVDMKTLLFSQPSSGEEALEIVEKMVRTGALNVVVVDSVAALVPQKELDGEMGDSHMGLQARMMAQAMRKLAGVASETGTLIIFVNQLREKVGIVFGSPITQPGGRALKFTASVRIELAKIKTLTTKGGEVSGSKVKAKIIKNKMAPPLRIAEFDIEYGQGINNTGCILDLGIEKGLFRQAGAWIYRGDQQVGQGRDRAIEYLNQDHAMRDEIVKEILAK